MSKTMFFKFILTSKSELWLYNLERYQVLVIIISKDLLL